jgi:hypothetical protein
LDRVFEMAIRVSDNALATNEQSLGVQLNNIDFTLGLLGSETQSWLGGRQHGSLGVLEHWGGERLLNSVLVNEVLLKDLGQSELGPLHVIGRHLQFFEVDLLDGVHELTTLGVLGPMGVISRSFGWILTAGRLLNEYHGGLLGRISICEHHVDHIVSGHLLHGFRQHAQMTLSNPTFAVTELALNEAQQRLIVGFNIVRRTTIRSQYLGSALA